jgi:transcriptional regulator with XRE-family HTH domain
MKINEKIRLMRESKNWTQADMAEKLNMSVGGYRKIEQGQSRADHQKLERFAQLFDVDLLELLSLGDGHVILVSDSNNHAFNIIGSSAEIAFEIQKLKSEVKFQQEIIELQKRDIARLEEIIALMKKSGDFN